MIGFPAMDPAPAEAYPQGADGGARPSVPGRAEDGWPGFVWPQSFEGFAEGLHEEFLAEGVA